MKGEGCFMKKIILYGAGIRGKRYANQMNEWGSLVSYFVDRDPEKIGTIVQNIPIISVEQLKTMDDYQLYITPKESDGIIEELIKDGIPKSNILSGFGMMATGWGASNLVEKILERKKESEVETVFFDCENGICLGGVESWCLDVGKGLTQRGHRVRYIAKKLPIELPDELENQMDYVRIQNSHMFEKLAVEDMITVIANNLPCTVIACMPDEVMVAACAVKRVVGDKICIISAMHNDISDYYEKNLALDEYIDSYICVSKKIQDEMKKRVSHPGRVYRKVSPIMHDKKLERSYTKNGEKIKLGLAGRLEVQQKRLDLLVPLLVKLKLRNVDYVLELAGDGAYLPEIRREVERFELEDNIIIHGRIDNNKMGEFWKHQDVCINLSDFEGRSLSVMEAMAAGAVPVLTDTSGNEDIIEGENGFVVPLEDIDKMAEIIDKLAADKDKLSNMGAKAHEVIVRECGYESYITFVEGLLWR